MAFVNDHLCQTADPLEHKHPIGLGTLKLLHLLQFSPYTIGYTLASN